MKKLFSLLLPCYGQGSALFSKTLSLQGEFINSSHRYIQYIGRISHKAPDAIRFNYPGVQIRASFRGTSLKNVCQAHEWIFYGKDRQRCPFKISFNSPPTRSLPLPLH